jgi:hypothetical protein
MIIQGFSCFDCVTRDVSACCDYIKQTVYGYDFYFVRHNNKYYYNLDNSTIFIIYRRVIVIKYGHVASNKIIHSG